MRARVFLLAVIAAGMALPPVASALTGATEVDLALFGVVAIACAAGNLFEVFAPGHYALQPNFAIFFFAAALLPPWASTIVAILAFLPGLLAGRTPWFKAAFNAANYSLGALAVYGVMASPLADAVTGTHGGMHQVALLLVAAVVFTVVNHTLLVLMASHASGERVRRNLHQVADGLPLDVALGLTGASLVALWQEAPALVALASGPLALVWRALALPQLEHQARTDPKTGIFNSEHFNERLEEELERARRTDGQLAVILVDLDHLREVNNRCGHLAGDRVIRGVADALQRVAGEAGVAARFGGEEYCLLLPEAGLEEARLTAERLRSQVKKTRFRLDDEDGEGGSIRVTLSAGVACYPEHGDSGESLIKAADVAVYEAKSAGRDRVRVALAPEARAALELAPEAPAPEAVEAPQAAAVPAPAAPVTSAEPATPADLPAAGPAPASETRRLVAPYATLLAAVAAVIGGLTVANHPPTLTVLAALLIGSVVALDLSGLDVFGRGQLSPGAVPSVALACAFGPVGPMFAEGVVTAVRIARGEGLARSGFNFGALGLSGAAAAGVFALAPDLHGWAMVALAAGAGLVYYAVNSILVAGVWALDESLSPATAWRHRFAWAAPHHLAFGAVAGLLLLAYDDMGTVAFAVFGFPLATFWLAQRQYLEHARESVHSLEKRHDELVTTNSRLRSVLGDNQDLVRRIHESYLATITALARTIEAKDPYTGDHTERVATFASRIAERLGFSDTEKRAIAVGAVIHDIGKIGIPDSILLKPGRLTEEEFAEMRRHPEISSYILADLELPGMVKEMVRSHHERYDGSGYPDRLTGEKIPLAARVLAVADALDAMTSDRPYRRAMPLDAALDEVRGQSGKQFCPAVVQALQESLFAEPLAWRRLAAEGAQRAA